MPPRPPIFTRTATRVPFTTLCRSDVAPARQIEVVSRLLDGMSWKVSRFTARESRRERESILHAFRVGLIDGLVAIKCLDEGIDVPACSTAYILARSEEHTSELQSLMRISYAVFCLKKKKTTQ